MRKEVIVALFLDLGNVLLTNGWDHTMRQRAAQKFAKVSTKEALHRRSKREHKRFDPLEGGCSYGKQTL